MLSLWQLLHKIKDGVLQSPQPVRIEYAAALATRDLAAKVLEVRSSPQFRSFFLIWKSWRKEP